MGAQRYTAPLGMRSAEVSMGQVPFTSSTPPTNRVPSIRSISSMAITSTILRGIPRNISTMKSIRMCSPWRPASFVRIAPRKVTQMNRKRQASSDQEMPEWKT